MGTGRTRPPLFHLPLSQTAREGSGAGSAPRQYFYRCTFIRQTDITTVVLTAIYIYDLRASKQDILDRLGGRL